MMSIVKECLNESICKRAIADKEQILPSDNNNNYTNLSAVINETSLFIIRDILHNQLLPTCN